MKEYRGNEDGRDIPVNGGSFVNETGDAHEKYNFNTGEYGGQGMFILFGDFSRQNHIMGKRCQSNADREYCRL